MNIDERIEALVTRQEAFSQSLELIIRIQQDSFEEHHKLLEEHQEMLQAQGKLLEAQGKLLEEHGKKLDQLERIAGVALDSIRSLERIAVAHEARIGRIEDQL